LQTGKHFQRALLIIFATKCEMQNAKFQIKSKSNPLSELVHNSQRMQQLMSPNGQPIMDWSVFSGAASCIF